MIDEEIEVRLKISAESKEGDNKSRSKQENCLKI